MPLTYTKRASLVFALLVAAYGYFVHTSRTTNHNVASRLGLIFAVVQEGRLTIDSFHDRPGTATNDKAFHNGHYYSDKAIGASVLGVLVYLPLHGLLQLLRWELPLPHLAYLINFFVQVLPAAFAGSLMYVLCEGLGASRRRAFVVTLAIMLGTMLWPFGTLLFGHVLSASLLFIAFFLMLRIKVNPQGARPRTALLIWLLLGFALITEYPTFLLVVPLGFYGLSVLRRATPGRSPWTWRTALYLGGLPPVAMLLAYNAACFGDPFSLGYSHLAFGQYREGMSYGLTGVGWPRALALYYLTVHPIRGLFAQSPVLLLALLGFVPLLRDRAWRVEGALSLWALVSFLVMNAGYYMWWGGSPFGPRHLVPMLPFLCLPLLWLPRRFVFLLIVLTAVSIGHMVIMNASTPITSDKLIQLVEQGQAPFRIIPFFGHSPIYDWALDRLLKEKFRANWGMLLGLRGVSSLLPLLVAMIAVSMKAAGALATRRVGSRLRIFEWRGARGQERLGREDP